MARKKTRPGDSPDAPPRVPRTYSALDATRRVLDTLTPGYVPSPGWYVERIDLEEARREVARVEDRIETLEATIEDLEDRIATLEAELVAARRAPWPVP